jgi:hypothetical protein
VSNEERRGGCVVTSGYGYGKVDVWSKVEGKEED